MAIDQTGPIDQMALIDMLTRLRNQSPPSISPDATGGSGMGSFMDMMQRTPPPQNTADPRAALLEQEFAPQQPQLVPEEPEWGKGRQIGSQIGAALADALGAYAQGLGSPVRVNASQQLMERIRQGREARGENERRKKSSEDEAKRARAHYERVKLDKAEELKRQDTIREEDRAFDLYRESGQIGAREDREARNRQIGKQEASEDRLYNLRLGAAKAGQSVPPDADEKTLLDAIARGERDQIARQERNREKPEKLNDKSLALGNSIAIGMYRGVPADQKSGAPAIPPVEERLNQGETPDSLLLEYEMELDSSGVFGQERAEAMKTYEKYVGASIRKWRANKALADKNSDLSGIKPEGKRGGFKIDPDTVRQFIGTRGMGRY